MNKFVYFNDTKKDVSIHPATETHGVTCDMSVIKPFEEREFELPEGTYAWVKQWENGMILVSPTKNDKSDNDEPKHLGKYPVDFSFTDEKTGEEIAKFCDEICDNQDVSLRIRMMLQIIGNQVKRHLNK